MLDYDFVLIGSHHIRKAAHFYEYIAWGIENSIRPDMYYMYRKRIFARKTVYLITLVNRYVLILEMILSNSVSNHHCRYLVTLKSSGIHHAF